MTLTEKSSNMIIFTTPFGRFRFKRLPFGIKSAPEVFHKNFSKIFTDIPEVLIYIDSLIILANKETELNQKYDKLLKWIIEYGTKFNKNKSQIKVKEVKFTQIEIEVDKNKIRAIEKLETPKTIKQLERFIPNMSQIATPFRELLKKGVNWYWGEEQNNCYTKLKELLTTEPILKYFDVKKDITLSVDA